MNRPIAEMLTYTYQQFVLQFTSFVFNAWDHTSLIAGEIDKLRCTVHNIVGPVVGVKDQAKPLQFRGLHIYSREAFKGDTAGLHRITIDNFESLKMVGGAMKRNK